MQAGIILAFAAYFSYALGDSVLKALGPHLGIFEIGFFVSIFAFIPVLFTKRPEDNWGNIARPTRPGLIALHMATGAACSITAVVAFTSLPLTEAYALIFLLPLIVTVLSAVFLKEPIGKKRWCAVVLGFIGVLLVVRPGFRELQFGHLAAVATAVFGASQVLILRAIGRSERRITILGALLVATISANAVLMLGSFAMPEGSIWWLLVGGGILMGLGHVGLVFATRLASGATVAPTHYSQIAWAVILGYLFFDEAPDLFTVLGMIVVGASGLFTFLREKEKTIWPQKTPLVRNR